MRKDNNMKNNPQKQSSIANFIDNLLFPPSIASTLRKSNSLKNSSEPYNNRQINLFDTRQNLIPLSPYQIKSKSQDKDTKIFNNHKSYIDQISNETSMVVSRLTQFEQAPSVTYIQKKGVRFRDNLIKRNSMHRRQNSSRQVRTPSILKKSKQIRQNSYNLIQKNLINSRIEQNNHHQINFMFQDKEGRATKTNQVVQKRFLTILERFNGKFSHRIKKQLNIKSQQKYKDELFPPIQSSVYRGGNAKLQEQNEMLKWVRLSDLFKHKKIVVVSQYPSNIEVIYNNNDQFQNSFVSIAFNCIKNCKLILQKIFQNKKQNQFGVYMVKIFEENVWKYVIIDDYIPTIQTQKGEVIPAFISIQQIYDRPQLQIWPFLLQKAYANYYANYQSLYRGNALDFLQQITGMAGEMFQYTLNTKKLIANNKRLHKYFLQDNIFYLGYRQSQNLYLTILKNSYNRPYITIQQQQIQLNIENIFEQIDKIYVFNCNISTNTNVSTIGMNIKKNTVQTPRLDISVRMLKITEKGMVSIAIRQKEKRFYQKSTLNYNYMWVRVFVFQKQFNGDCRWVDGKFSNSKSINIFKNLDAGQYYIIVLPQWKSSHCYELSVIVNSKVQTSLARKEYDERQRLVDKGCTDLAQRMGKLNQINLFACSYSYIYQQIGLLIQNINNERYNGQIRINRSISGLRAAVQLIPFNIQFYQNKNPKLPYKTQISVSIPSDQYYTVILMMRGGIDHSFMKRFDFGK